MAGRGSVPCIGQKKTFITASFGIITMLKSSMLIWVLGTVLLLARGIVCAPIEHDDSVSDDLVSQIFYVKSLMISSYITLYMLSIRISKMVCLLLIAKLLKPCRMRIGLWQQVYMH